MDDDDLDDGQVFSLRASPAKRVVGAIIMVTLALLLIWLGLTTASDFFGKVIFFGIGGGSLYLAQRFWVATQDAVDLTEDGLRLRSGRMLAPFDDIVSVDRGAFAFKPSNGFMLKLVRAPGRGRAPGLGWSIGKLVAVGGGTPAPPGGLSPSPFPSLRERPSLTYRTSVFFYKRGRGMVESTW